jgi:hypothetical protein
MSGWQLNTPIGKASQRWRVFPVHDRKSGRLPTIAHLDFHVGFK